MKSALLALLAPLALAACGDDHSQNELRNAQYQAASTWCAQKSAGGPARVLWVCHDAPPLVVACAPATATTSPCDDVMVEP